MESQNLNILDEVNKGATMGMDAISYVSEKASDSAATLWLSDHNMMSHALVLGLLILGLKRPR